MPNEAEVSAGLKELMAGSSREVIKVMNSTEETEGGQTVEELYQFVEKYCNVPAIGNKDYEDCRKDYLDTMEVWKKLQVRIDGLKGNLEILQTIMNAGNIKQEVFNQFYETQRDLTYCFGQETALLLRRSASAVVFQAQVNKN